MDLKTEGESINYSYINRDKKLYRSIEKKLKSNIQDFV